MLAAGLLGASSAQAAGQVHGVIASYHGKQIDLSKGWQGAHHCVVHGNRTAECFDAEQLTVAATALDVCPSEKLTFWDQTDWHGRSVSFDQPGLRYFSSVGFENQAASWCNMLPNYGQHANLFNGSGYALRLGWYVWEGYQENLKAPYYKTNTAVDIDKP
ncbi:hypothetical protein D5S17_06570 [Pseudonocardiaceae bacterium YIM PH 21723]|nr:hypothetical protein D5S17_06570 [Pseudonocardiaceae bacterium YIM PH 21723]